jgi:OOP family OmpA-OmpF porin
MRKAVVNSLALAGALVALPGAASAQGMWLDNLSIYGGLGVGAGQIDSGDIPGDADAVGGVDDESTVYKAFIGTNLNEMFALEAGYISFGDVEEEDPDTDIFDEATSFEADGITTSLIGFLPITERFLVHAKVGALFWDAESRVGQVSAGEDGTDAFFGVGATYEFTERWAVRGEYDRFQLDDTDIDTVFASVVFSF